MSRGILDTGVLVATGIAPIPGELAISAVSLAELHFGVLVAKTAESRATRLSRLSADSTRFLSTTPSQTATAASPPESRKSAANRAPGSWTC